MSTRANIIAINDYTTLIDDAGESSAYLVRGRDKAVLIDTLNGVENLAELVATLTDRPVMVVNTHGHIDHIGCNHNFPEAWIHRDDLNIYRQHFQFLRQGMKDGGAPFLPTGDECKMHLIEPGTVLDLGGVTLEIVAIPGHTPGSIALLDRAARLLFTGDAINGQIWMQLDHSTKLATYLASLNALEPLRGAFDGMYGGHVGAAVPTPTAYIDTMKKGVTEILNGDTANDDDWPWFEGMARRHMLGPDSWILYTQDKVD